MPRYQRLIFNISNLKLQRVADAQGFDGNLLLLQVAVHGRNTGDLRGQIEHVLWRRGNRGAIGLVHAHEMDIHMLIFRGVSERQHAPGMHPSLGEHLDAGCLGSNRGAIGSKAQVSFSAGNNRRLFGIIGILQSILCGKPNPRRKGELENQHHE